MRPSRGTRGGLPSGAGYMSSKNYLQVFELLAFWQAICVTCLILSGIAEPISGWKELTLYALAWSEWPVMLFGVMPVLLQRIVVRASIAAETDDVAVRRVSLKAKEAALRFHVRLVQLIGYEKRAKVKHDAWASEEFSDFSDEEFHPSSLVSQGEEGTVTPIVALESSVPRSTGKSSTGESSGKQKPKHWSKYNALQNWRRGMQLFRRLPYRHQQEIEEIFETLDVFNTEEISVQELNASFEALGFTDESQAVAASLLRSVDHDSSHRLTWSKFQALAALATGNLTETALQEDLRMMFKLIDGNDDGRITVFQLTDWLHKLKSGMNEVDVASLLYRHFSQAKPIVSEDEFIDWIQEIGTGRHGRQRMLDD